MSVSFPRGTMVTYVTWDVSSSEQIWRNLALHNLLTNGSSAVNGCHQNKNPNI